MRPDIFIRRGEAGFTVRDRLKACELPPGPPKRRVPGGFVAGDLAELKKSILLCPSCHHKFDWKRYCYYPVWKYEHMNVRGNCDACKAHTDVGRFFLHETNVNRVIVTKAEDRRQRRYATVVGG